MLSDEELSDEAVLPPLLLTLEFPVFPVAAEVVPLLVVPELPLLPELLLELLRERGVDMPEEKANATSVRFELKDEKQIAKIKELYRLDYEIPVGC